jgi:LCP family protein required for cell wall assembly
VAPNDKPYRVYRGGRGKGPRRRPPVPLREQLRPSPPTAPRDGGGAQAPGAPRPPRPRRTPRRRWPWLIAGILVLLVILVVVWGTLGFLSFRSGISEANQRLPGSARHALAPQDGSLLSSPSTILLLGADHGPGRGSARGRSDAMLLVRTDPDEHRIAYLSIPRDLRVEIPGHGLDKINAAYSYGGPALAISTVENMTGLPVNHVAVVDFNRFRDVIDALGGVSIDVPRPIESNRFDCPFKTPAECARWGGWRFAKGKQEMDGRRALVYARIRENQLDPAENDLTRGGRQQQVIEAIGGKVASLRGFVRLPFIGKDIVKPLSTDLSAWQLAQLGWVRFRAASDRTLRCRLGGDVSSDGAYVIGNEQNRLVLSMVTGDSAPQPPPPGSGLYGAGCVVGKR